MRKLLLLTILLLAIPLVSAHGGFDDGHPDEPLNLPEGVIKIIEYRNQLAASITFLIAFIAGIISFTSPCGFVVLPTFFSFLFKERKKAVLMTAFFCIGLVLAFTLLGVAAALLGSFINEFKEPFAVISGAIFILLGVMTFLNKGFTWFQFKLDHHKAKNAMGMTVLGFFFALGWTPCVGPVLSGILLLAANSSTILTGTSYLIFYALGVSLPLLILALLSDKFDLANKSWIRGKMFTFKLFGKEIITHTYNIISAIILIFIGIVMITWRGTQFFEIYIPMLIPWSMDAFYRANDALTMTPFYTSGAAHAIGIILGLLVLGWLVLAVVKAWRSSREL